MSVTTKFLPEITMKPTLSLKKCGFITEEASQNLKLPFYHEKIAENLRANWEGKGTHRWHRSDTSTSRNHKTRTQASYNAPGENTHSFFKLLNARNTSQAKVVKNFSALIKNLLKEHKDSRAVPQKRPHIFLMVNSRSRSPLRKCYHGLENSYQHENAGARGVTEKVGSELKIFNNEVIRNSRNHSFAFLSEDKRRGTLRINPSTEEYVPAFDQPKSRVTRYRKQILNKYINKLY